MFKFRNRSCSYLVTPPDVTFQLQQLRQRVSSTLSVTYCSMATVLPDPPILDGNAPLPSATTVTNRSRVVHVVSIFGVDEDEVLAVVEGVEDAGEGQKEETLRHGTRTQRKGGSCTRRLVKE